MVPTQKTACLTDGKKFKFEIVDDNVPSPGPNEVLVKLSVSGICGTDVALATGKLGPTQKILGHEGVGRVVQLGSAVSAEQASIGQRVGVAWMRDACGSCRSCLVDGGETRCLLQVQSGRKVAGTFAQYAIVPARYLTSLPEGQADEMLAPILCGGVTAYKALKVCGATPGQWVAITGAAGGVGALGIQYAVAMGYRVIAIDAGPQNGAVCLELGAEHYVDGVADVDASGTVRKLTGEKNGVQAAIIAAGASQSYQDGIDMLAPFGTLVCVGIPPPDKPFSVHPLKFIDLGIRIIGSAVGTRGDIAEAVDFVIRNRVTPRVKVVPFEYLESDSKPELANNAKLVIDLK